MQASSKIRFSAMLALLVVAVLAFATAEEGQPAVRSSSPRPAVYPAPTNLRALPKDLTGLQVHDIMEEWSGSLSVRCDSCHTEDPKNVGPDGSLRLDYADDSKPMKGMARMMYRMTEQINDDFITKIHGAGMPVTCGTCHRGRISPEPFLIPLTDESSPVLHSQEQGPTPRQP
ncbi:MAG TPA: c-type cytochrome [Terracidiphilus sp.]|nr:c-type cytochrome [Terracidiphilus sp.]